MKSDLAIAERNYKNTASVNSNKNGIIMII